MKHLFILYFFFFSMVGFSYYFNYLNSNSPLTNVNSISATIRHITEAYGKPVIIVEAAYYWSGVDAMSGCIQQHQANPIPGLTTIPSVALLIPRNANSLPIAEKNDLTSLKSVLTIAGIRFTEVSDSALKA